MKTKGLIKFLKQDQDFKYDDFEIEMVEEIIKRLEHYEELKKALKDIDIKIVR